MLCSDSVLTQWVGRAAGRVVLTCLPNRWQHPGNKQASFYNGITPSQECRLSDTFDYHFTTVSHYHRCADFSDTFDYHFTTVSHYHSCADFQKRLIIILQRYHTITGMQTFRHVWLSFYNGITQPQVWRLSETFDCHFTMVSHYHRCADFQTRLIVILQRYHTITGVQTFRHARFVTLQ